MVGGVKDYYAVLLALVLVLGCGKGEQSTNTNQSNNTPEKSAKKKAEKETPTSTSWVSDPSDPNNVKIETAIRKAVGKPTGKLTKVDLEKVTRLPLYDSELTDVTALKELTQLQALHLNGNQLTDVKELENLTQLKKLSLDENQLTRVKGLEKLTQLKELWLKDNPDLNKAQIDELKKALPKCFISSNPTLNAEESAKFIDAAIRKAAKKPTGELTEADLKKVAELRFEDCQLTDVTTLKELTQLKELDLIDNPLTKAQIVELQKALPKCKIYSNPTK